MFVRLNNTSNSSNSRNNNNKYICKNPTYPSFVATITSIQKVSVGDSNVIYIRGSNFFPPVYNTTFVNFGNFTNLPIEFYSCFYISFIIPTSAINGTYNITVLNIYNKLCTPCIYPGINTYSNAYFYELIN